MSKYSVKINYLEDIRRFSLQEGVAWEGILKTIQNIFPTINSEEWQNIQIVYKDDEGDLVIISSDDEFKEAIFQLSDVKRILRLHIQKKVAPTNEKPVRRCGRNIQKRDSLCYNRLNNRALQLMDGNVSDLEKAKRLFTRARNIRPSQCSPVYNIACVEAILGNKEAALKALEESVRLGYDNVDHMEKDEDLKSLRETDKFKQIVSSLKKNKPGSPPQNPYFGLQNNIFSLFNAGNKDALETARQLLFSQVNLVPQDPIPAYNLACVEALLNNPQVALLHLQNNLGFKNLSHILQDKDLKSLHPLEAFQSLIATLNTESTFRPFTVPIAQVKKEQPSPSQPQPTVPIVAPPVIPSPVVVPVSIPEPVVSQAQSHEQSELEKGMQLLQEMGFTDIRANLIALTKAGGNVDNAISDLLDQF